MTKERLDEFYNSNHRFKKHKWDAQRTKGDEFRLITDRLLKLVGGSIGHKRDEANKVVIGVGLGKFSSKFRLFSLHESFQSYFVQNSIWMGITLGCKMQGITQMPEVVPAAVLTAITLWCKDKDKARDKARDKAKGELVGASESPPWRLTKLM
ncbi:hypothetical protein BG011_009811 [Mortierella polycephala]|uniref:Uncharacterized protein n=1 Tax=Mortierella polycephala TaxID=41804 RepID=A0A9P6PMS5_9FUNG|nr:hypothetical protein BG011_009811 [Mortierella polycephala]